MNSLSYFLRLFAAFSGLKQFSPFRFRALDRLECTAIRRVRCGRAGFRLMAKPNDFRKEAVASDDATVLS
jgi:hypothetical protein